MDEIIIAGMTEAQIIKAYPQLVAERAQDNLIAWTAKAKKVSKKYWIMLSSGMFLTLILPFILFGIVIPNPEPGPLDGIIFMLCCAGFLAGFVIMMLMRKVLNEKQLAEAKAVPGNALILTAMIMRRDAMYTAGKTHWFCHKCGKWTPWMDPTCRCGTGYDQNLSTYRFNEIIRKINDAVF